MQIVKIILGIMAFLLCFAVYKVVYLPMSVVKMNREAAKLISSRPEAALKMFIDAEAISKHNVDSLTGMGEACLKMGKPEKVNELYGDLFLLPAMQKFEGVPNYRVIKNAEVFYLWGQANLLTKDYALAKKALDKSCDILNRSNLSEREMPGWEKDVGRKRDVAKKFLKNPNAK